MVAQSAEQLYHGCETETVDHFHGGIDGAVVVDAELGEQAAEGFVETELGAVHSGDVEVEREARVNGLQVGGQRIGFGVEVSVGKRYVLRRRIRKVRRNFVYGGAYLVITGFDDERQKIFFHFFERGIVPVLRQAVESRHESQLQHEVIVERFAYEGTEALAAEIDADTVEHAEQQRAHELHDDAGLIAEHYLEIRYEVAARKLVAVRVGRSFRGSVRGGNVVVEIVVIVVGIIAADIGAEQIHYRFERFFYTHLFDSDYRAVDISGAVHVIETEIIDSAFGLIDDIVLGAERRIDDLLLHFEAEAYLELRRDEQIIDIAGGYELQEIVHIEDYAYLVAHLARIVTVVLENGSEIGGTAEELGEQRLYERAEIDSGIVFGIIRVVNGVFRDKRKLAVQVKDYILVFHRERIEVIISARGVEQSALPGTELVVGTVIIGFVGFDGYLDLPYFHLESEQSRKTHIEQQEGGTGFVAVAGRNVGSAYFNGERRSEIAEKLAYVYHRIIVGIDRGKTAALELDEDLAFGQPVIFGFVYFVIVTHIGKFVDTFGDKSVLQYDVFFGGKSGFAVRE